MVYTDESRVFQLGNIFAANENNVNDATVHLTELKGWEETRAEFVTVPKLFGAGSYLQEKNLPEKEITVKIAFAKGVTFVKNILDELEAQTHAMTPLTASRMYGSRRTESMTVYVVGITELEKFSDYEAIVQVTLLALNPIKTIS